MERLTAFEFIAATDGPQLVRLKNRDIPVMEFGVVAWFGVSQIALEFERREDLVIEGPGLGHPYWNDEQPPWTVVFDPVAEAKRILAIHDAAQREMNRRTLVTQ